MSDNPRLNESIREKLKKEYLKYGLLGLTEVEEDCWEEWDTYVAGDEQEEAATGKAFDLLWEWIQSCGFNPVELIYIHENLAPEAWDKLGLELPKVNVPQLSAEENWRWWLERPEICGQLVGLRKMYMAVVGIERDNNS